LFYFFIITETQKNSNVSAGSAKIYEFRKAGAVGDYADEGAARCAAIPD